MKRRLVIDAAATAEAAAQAAYYATEANESVARRFVEKILAIYDGLEADRYAGSSYPRVRFAFRSSASSSSDSRSRSSTSSRVTRSPWWPSKRCGGDRSTGALVCRLDDHGVAHSGTWESGTPEHE
ncbi:MAG: hypothetical protein KIT31_12925 [Deltaproteobacteria bacterium]|nr:hypothetical protein [Deltaproteobacteria bacterium]